MAFCFSNIMYDTCGYTVAKIYILIFFRSVHGPKSFPMVSAAGGLKLKFMLWFTKGAKLHEQMELSFCRLCDFEHFLWIMEQ